MTPAIAGGILLMIGSYFVSKGEIYKSVIAFWLADIAWVFLALLSGDIFGSITVFIGMTFGIIAFLKMHKGEIRKDLHW